MPSSYLTELALRAAANMNKRILTREGGQADAIQKAALKRSQELILGNSDDATAPLQLGTQTQAIHLAIQCLGLAYTAITKQINDLNHQRLSFDKERQAGIATFMMPTHKEESDLSQEEKVIKGFLALISKASSFSTYLGIHNAETLTDKGSKFYSIIPFYRMSEALSQPVASNKPLDRQRTAVNLFLKSALPEAISDIDTGFQADSKFVAFWESTIQRENYLNNRRAPRFIMMSLSNLLWNLQHPVDPVTGYPLSLTRCIEICHDVELCLNQLLNSESPPYVQNISNSENGLMSFLRKLEVYTKALRTAYAEEQLHELNIDEITNSAHRALRIINTSIFKLIYKRYNPISRQEEPDENAAEILADMVTYLNLLLIRNPDLIHAFQPVPEWILLASEINRPPVTIVDLLIIFCHLSWRERDQLLAKIELSNTDSAKEFSQRLRKFSLEFVKPIKTVSKQELHATVFDPRHEEVSRLTARRLVPLLALVIKDYRVEVDTPTTCELAKRSQDNPTAARVRNGKQQVQAINLSALAGQGYYLWTLSPFIKMSAEITAEIDGLPKRQYRMTQMTELLDSVSELVKDYRSFLQNKSFQTFLLKCLNNVKEEYAALERHIDRVDTYLAHDERMSRSLQSILRPMTRDLNSSLDTFALATANFERLVSAPDFSDQQRQVLASKLGTISEQYSVLFTDNSGIAALMNVAPITHTPTIPPEIVEAKKVLALTKLVQRCYNALSYQSREGHKGLLLRELIKLIEDKPNFTEGQIKHVIMELTRVTASYRETWLFQAAYGQTRSARALIAAIKDPGLNSVLPLASIIFDQSRINILQVSDSQILDRLRHLREGYLWQESSSKITEISI